MQSVIVHPEFAAAPVVAAVSGRDLVRDAGALGARELVVAVEELSAR